MKENEVADQLMVLFPKMNKLIKAIDQFSYFDYENDNYLFEIKSRRKSYDPWIIEQLKVDTNIGIAESVKKDFIYVNEFEFSLYIWNISKLIRNNYDFRFQEREMPWHTDFKKTESINKMVGYLYNKDALIVSAKQ
tara:strand:+ start:4585 stop:4992 length:408 start_codon:yes stop_codon:yes gene_type:complete